MKANAPKRKVFQDALDLLAEDPVKDTPVAVNGIVSIPVEEIHPFHDHPFRLYEGDRLEDMVQSIREYGVLNPVIDYLTGVMCAFADHTLSSEVGFRGICRKVLIFLLVGMANILDVSVIGNGSVLRTAVIFFYISNEGVSLLENAGHLGLPIPQKMKEVLEQLHDREEGSDGE